jgi:hypothetical protein
MERLVTSFPRLAGSLDYLRDRMLLEADIPDEKVELNIQHIIRRTNEMVPRLYSKQADILDNKENNFNNFRIEKERDNKVRNNKIRHKIERLEIQKQGIIKEVENNVQMSNSVRDAHKEHINIIEHE